MLVDRAEKEMQAKCDEEEYVQYYLDVYLYIKSNICDNYLDSFRKYFNRKIFKICMSRMIWKQE